MNTFSFNFPYNNGFVVLWKPVHFLPLYFSLLCTLSLLKYLKNNLVGSHSLTPFSLHSSLSLSLWATPFSPSLSLSLSPPCPATYFLHTPPNKPLAEEKKILVGQSSRLGPGILTPHLISQPLVFGRGGAEGKSTLRQNLVPHTGAKQALYQWVTSLAYPGVFTWKTRRLYRVNWE